MYIDKLNLKNVRTFVKNDISFVHPDLEFRPKSETNSESSELLPKPRLPNVNLLLGDNGSGKTTVLQAIALSSLGPAAVDAKLQLNKYVRFSENRSGDDVERDFGIISASLRLHAQDAHKQAETNSIASLLSFQRIRELERLSFVTSGDLFSKEAGKGLGQTGLWGPVYESKNDAFFCVAYGATRRVESGENMDSGRLSKSSFLRAQRLQSIFQDSFALFPLQYWLPQLKSENPGRYTQVVHLINRLLGPGHYRFTEEMQEREYLFERGGMKIPFRSLSDGYRAFVAWIADLLYHICYGCPSGKKLDESSGIVLVDEIDLHLHPKWQMKVIETISKTLPRMQFIFTSHSPLVVGSLEWMNIITLKVSQKSNRTASSRLRQSVHGLDADQILLTDFFGLKSTMAPAKEKQLEEIRSRIRAGDKKAPLQLIREMSSGTEVEE
jgi:hypothetical protein